MLTEWKWFETTVLSFLWLFSNNLAVVLYF